MNSLFFIINFIKFHKIISIIYMFVFIALLILGMYFSFYWYAGNILLLCLLFLIYLKIHYKFSKRFYHLSSNMIYKIILINIDNNNARKLGQTYEPITYMYINTKNNTVAFPETKYGLNKIYKLESIYNRKKIIVIKLIDLSNRKSVYIKIHDLSIKSINFLEELVNNAY